jgi:hypothetical protein
LGRPKHRKEINIEADLGSQTGRDGIDWILLSYWWIFVKVEMNFGFP